MDFSTKFNAHVTRVEQTLDRLVPPAPPTAESGPARIREAMRYSLRAGGKRLRPALVLASAELAGGATGTEQALPFAAAVECIHTYSLIHDDLPCMDDDDLRRGRPTCHRAFDEATALLAGDALLAEAFALVARGYADRPAVCATLVRELAEAASADRLVGGQMQDLLAEIDASGPTAVTPELLDFIHRHKTAALLEASLVGGGAIGGWAGEQLETLRRAGRLLGLAFQIVDDVLDATASSAVLGKTAGKDARAGKATSVSVLGLEAARELAARRTAEARAAFSQLPGDPGFLVALTEQLLSRDR